jgi:hypothetical protein
MPAVPNEPFAEKLKIRLANAERAENSQRRTIQNSIRITEASAASELTLDDIDLGDLEKDVAKNLQAVNEFGVETSPRDLLIKLIGTVEIDVEFEFKTVPGGGENFVQAMRMVLSRVRARAKRKKLPLDEFKLLFQKCERLENYDVVTVMRSKSLSPKDESMYDDLTKLMAKQTK